MDWHGFIEKSNRFSTFQATLPSKRSASLLKLRLFGEFPINLVKSYILRRHFTGGWKGFYFAVGQAFMRTSRIAKMLEAQEMPKTKATVMHPAAVHETASNTPAAGAKREP